MVDVAHDGHDRRAGLQVGRGVVLEEDLLGRLRRRRLAVGLDAGRLAAGRDRLRDLVAELARDERSRVAVDQLVDAREDAALDELADHVGRVDAQLCREVLDRDRGRKLDRASFARIEDLDRRRDGSGLAPLWLARTPPITRAAPGPGQSHLLCRRCRHARIRRAGSSFCGPRFQTPRSCVRHGCLERPPEGVARERLVPAAAVGAEVGAAAGCPASFVDVHAAVRRTDDPHQLSFLPARPAGHARPLRVALLPRSR